MAFDKTKQQGDRKYSEHGFNIISNNVSKDESGNVSDYSELYNLSFSDLFIGYSGGDLIQDYDNSEDTSADSYAELEPIEEGETGDPSVKDLNPLERHNFNSDGKVLVKGASYGVLPNTGGKAPKGNFGTMTARGIALKLPIMLSGWGFDEDGNQTSDTYDGKLPGGSGIKVGPLDVRWNEERRVWVASGGGSITDHRHLSESDGGVAMSVLYPTEVTDVIDSGLIHIIPAALIAASGVS